MNTDITIERVATHNGSEFSGTKWKSPMQVIYSNAGLLIDNVQGNCFGHSGIIWEGIDWSKYTGKTVKIIVVDCAGRAFTNFVPCTSFQNLIRDYGTHYHLGRGYHGCPNHLWAYPFFLFGEPNIRL